MSSHPPPSKPNLPPPPPARPAIMVTLVGPKVSTNQPFTKAVRDLKKYRESDVVRKRCGLRGAPEKNRGKSKNRSLNQATNLSTNLPINQPTFQPSTYLPIHPPTYQPTSIAFFVTLQPRDTKVEAMVKALFSACSWASQGWFGSGFSQRKSKYPS